MSGKRLRTSSGWVGPAVGAGVGVAGRLYSAYSQSRKRKYQSSAMQGSLTLRRTRRRVGRNRRRNANEVYRQWLGRSNRVVYRWQQVSSSLLGPGRVAIQWVDQEGTEFDKMPMYFMSLSQYPYGGAAWDKENGSRDDGLKRWQYANTAPGNGKWVFFPLSSQSHNGGPDDPSGHWWLEQQSGRPSPESPHAYRTHAWTQIKLNLYGTLSVPITYTVMIYQCPECLDPQKEDVGLPGHVGGSDVANMNKDMVRSLVGNNLLTNGRVDWPKDVRIVRKYTKTIQPLPYSDQVAMGGSAASTAHVENMNIFIRHDRARDYRWRDDLNDQIPAVDLTNPSWDVYRENQQENDVEWGKKVYMMITASCPERLSATAGLSGDLLSNDAVGRAIMETAGSFDILVRQCFYLTGNH